MAITGHMAPWWGALLVAGGLALSPAPVLGVHGEPTPPPSSEPILPIPMKHELDPAKVALGERLFHDPRLARNNAQACANCHQLNRAGTDGLARSITNSGTPEVVNTPTVFNTVFNFRQTWRGAFRSLEEQAEADLHSPRHANTTWEELLPKLRADERYRSDFDRLYPQGFARESVLDAIATYERSLITPNSRFDQFLRGRADALSKEELQGYQLFKNLGCVSCHQGINVGGNLFQKLGIFKDYFKRRGTDITQADLGKFNVSGVEQDKHVFRVPSLRNVALTAPYFHDGSVKTLSEAVAIMGETQLGRTLKGQEIALLVAFLSTLTGEYQGRSLSHD